MKIYALKFDVINAQTIYSNLRVHYDLVVDSYLTLRDMKYVLILGKNMSKTILRNTDLDILKAIAIIAVVFYHMELLPLGYLGVDIFLVINGFLVTKGLDYSLSQGTFCYWSFVIKRIVRIWPLVVISSIVSLLVGYAIMLPDDLENLCQSIFASNIFANNILSCITTADYWNASNAFKPLMHMWYLGIIVQFYLIYPLFFLIVNKACKNYQRSKTIVVCILSILSILLFMLPCFSEAQKFYYLPFRFFEMSLGGLLAIQASKSKDLGRIPKPLLMVVLALCLLSTTTTTKMFDLLSVSFITIVLITFSLSKNEKEEPKYIKYFSCLGKGTFSIYIWHQVIYAFYKYAVRSQLELWDYAVLILLIVVVSAFSYFLFEKPISNLCKNKQKLVFAVSLLCALIVSANSLYIYNNAGVVRDVPELNIVKGKAERGMYAKYCDRVYEMQKDFLNNGKPKIIAIGDSYARDMVNVLLESKYADSIDIVYVYAKDVLTKKQLERVKQADVILVRAAYAGNTKMQQIYEYANTKYIFGISNKEYGETNGNEYQYRNSPNYFKMRAAMAPDYLEEYKKEKAIWGENLIDFVAPVADENYNVKIFTPDHKFISQDCRHLTRAGAKFYASILDIKRLIRFK